MTLAVVQSRALEGLTASPVTVEVHLANGLPACNIVGLPEAEVRESRDRVRAALTVSGFEFPNRRITINLAPADLPKSAGHFDLPIAIGILAASGQIAADKLHEYEFAGELGLTGELRAIRGALALAVASTAAQHKLIISSASAPEAALISQAEVLAAESLLVVCRYLMGTTALPKAEALISATIQTLPDLAEVRGQQQAKRALEIAAAGGHSLLMIGPPGTGKSMLAQRFSGLLPPMSPSEALEAATVQSLGYSGLNIAQFGHRPFRAPHHTASSVALVGGGGNPQPGEISLAHHGVLFLDELPEFDRKVLEVLREPLESGRILISRAARQAEFPARFQLIAAMNPCPCGYFGHARHTCRCTPDQIARYRNKISGPLLDRIDLVVEVPAVPEATLLAAADGESSTKVRERVIRARERQLSRQDSTNHMLLPSCLDQYCALDGKGKALLQNAISKLGLSARASHRILRIARTIADLVEVENIQTNHIAEAVQFRRSLSGA
ncbi:MAG: YifB family Mg chelatase-like AAA ATPase [Formivibrio sp.]|nr:YifB family Mg chelatase-like AAA ATPase [Formivibrio sp.]